jgi:hypothetical protein
MHRFVNGNGFSAIFDEEGLWVIGRCDSPTLLPTVGIPEGSLAYDNTSKALLVFREGAWSFGIPVIASAPADVQEGSYVVLETDTTIRISASTADLTVTLPDATEYPGRILNIKKMDDTAFGIIITPSHSQTIDGETTQTLVAQYENLQIQSDGSNWVIL